MTKLTALVGTVSMAAVLLTAPSAVAVPNTAQTPDPNLIIKSVTLGRSTVLVSGLNRFAVGVTVKAEYVADGPQDPLALNVYLKRTGGVGPLGYMVAGYLELTAGTVRDGTYTGTLSVPSTANGTFTVEWVMRGSLHLDIPQSYALFAGPSIAVTGVHVPKLVAQVIPRVVPFGSPYQVKTAIYDSATGKPYGTRIPVGLAADDILCHLSAINSGRTNTAGILYTSFPAASANPSNCIRVLGPAFDTINLFFLPLRPGIVGVTPSKTSVPVGTVVPVNGTVADAPENCAVLLQRLHGRTVWRLASQGAVRWSGRFTVRAQPPNRGNNSYRAYFPTCGRYQAGYSRTFAIQGT
jgi:hypothetical protein